MNDLTALQSAIATIVAEWKRDKIVPHAEAPKWILPPKSCDFLQSLCRVLQNPVSVFEFGSGRSTYALRAVCERVVSVEDSSEWLAKTEIAPNAIPKRPRDITEVVPLTKCWNRFRIIESFNIESNPALLKALEDSKLVLVDSPPNPAKREHALFQALDHTREGTLIVVDDLNVGATKRFCARLARQNQARFLYWHLPFDHELGVFLKIHPSRICSCPSLREIFGAWRRL